MNGVIVDGVAYTSAQVRRLVRERHELASEVVVLRDRLRRNDRHLRLRTDALIRSIARKGPVLS